MPVYEYTCKKCDEEFDRIESVTEHDPAKVRCPKCRSKRVERRWAGVQVVTSKKS